MGGRLMPRRSGLSGYAEDEDPFASHRVGYDARLKTTHNHQRQSPPQIQPQQQIQPQIQPQTQPPPHPQHRQQPSLALKTASLSTTTTTPPSTISTTTTTTTAASTMQGPSGALVLDGYRRDMANGEEKPLYNPANALRPQSSMQLDLSDPVQVHLLVETALVDSREYEILAPEEVDALKREIQSLAQRIEQVRQNLAIQSKYRDAANSMAKLYGTSPDKKRSLVLHARTDSVKEADLERQQSERRCEALAAELWTLEKRLMAPQNKLLKHTAGILQMTHKGPKNTLAKGVTAPSGNGIPGSPESIYTYHNGRANSEPISDEIVFDERSFYRTADRLDAFSDTSTRDSLGGPPPRSQARDQMQLIAKTEQALEDLNTRLRDVIVAANPGRQDTYGLPPPARASQHGQGRASDPSESLQSHLDYLGRSIQTIGQEHDLAARHQQEAERAVEERVEELNREIRGLLLPYDPHHPEPPEPTGDGLNRQLLYFQESIGAVEMELSSAARKGARLSASGEAEKMVQGLWEIIQAGEQEARQRKLERRQARAANNLPPDEDDSPDDGPDYPETFSLPAFSTKIQMLHTQATRLKDQKKVLQRQIKQQRELNNKSDATKDAELQAKVEELDRVNAFLARTEADADRTREELSDAMSELELLREQGARGASLEEVEAGRKDLEAAHRAVHELEDQMQELRDDHQIALAESEARIAELTAQVEQTDGVIKEKEGEVDRVKVEVARLQTEVTLARAELDGAYGTRAERAAEVAAMQSPIDAQQVQTLKKELDETITEYEAMTKASIEWEKERDRLEEAVDRLRDEKEALETKLNEEKVRWMGMQSPGSDASAGGSASTGTMHLRNEFKKMMRDTRTEAAKALRAEQAERRKVEDELRALKRQQGPGKSGLSQSVRSPA